MAGRLGRCLKSSLLSDSPIEEWLVIFSSHWQCERRIAAAGCLDWARFYLSGHDSVLNHAVTREKCVIDTDYASPSPGIWLMDWEYERTQRQEFFTGFPFLVYTTSRFDTGLPGIQIWRVYCGRSPRVFVEREHAQWPRWRRLRQVSFLQFLYSLFPVPGPTSPRKWVWQSW